MSTPFYDLASLVVVPSGYKASKVYAQKPLTTDGQLTFSRASTATRVNSAGLIETVSSNVPRLDYQGSTCPKILLEPQRTNLALYSEAFGTASYWYANNATITSNSVVSPDGYTNADTYTAAGANNYLNGSATSAGSNTVTFSVFVKAGTVSQFRLRESYYYGTSTVFNIANGTVIAGTGTITSYGNGWYRCTHTQTYGAGEVNLSWTYDLNTAASGTAYIYGAMAEVGAYPTSYIPTTTAAVTRLADACSKTGISSLIGQTEGTAFIDLTITKPDTGNADFLLLENTATPTNGVYVLFMYQTGQIGFFSYPSAAFAYVNSVNYSGQRLKVAYAYSAAGLVVYINGTQVYSNAIVSLGTGMSTFGFNNPNQPTINTKISETLIFKTRLTNAQLAELTTL